MRQPGAAWPPCRIVQFQSNTYVIQADDPDPCPTRATWWSRTSATPGARLLHGQQHGAVHRVDRPGDRLHEPPSPDSTPCADIDGDLCTTAGCNAIGSCDQAHLTTPCPPDGNPCTNDLACNPQTGQCQHPPLPDSTPCPDTDQNLCTSAGCEQGACVQPHVDTPCPPDNNEARSTLPATRRPAMHAPASWTARRAPTTMGTTAPSPAVKRAYAKGITSTPARPDRPRPVLRDQARVLHDADHQPRTSSGPRVSRSGSRTACAPGEQEQ
jgi:hypothetical protein